MSEDITTREVTESRGACRIVRSAGVAELTCSILTPTRMIAVHTGVAAALEGQGVANKLPDRLLADAAAEGFTIVPLWPCVNVQARLHPE